MKAGAFAGVLVLAMTGLMAVGAPPAPTDPLLIQYFSIQKSLASDSLKGVVTAAAEIAKLSRQAASNQSQGKNQLIALSDFAAKYKPSDLKTARNGFGDLSDRLIAYLKAAKAKRNPPFEFHCSMVNRNWLQPDKAIRNPYYGSSMLTCGEWVQ